MRALFSTLVVMMPMLLLAQWEHTGGPAGGYGYQIQRVGETELVAAMSYGIYRTTNNGYQWQPSGLDGRTVYRLLWIESIQRLFAATDDTLWVSLDRGQTWSFNVEFGGDITSLLYANDYFYVSVQEIYDSTYGGIYRSEDLGKNFTRISTQKALTNVRSIVTNATGNVLIAATYNDGVWRSVNGGSTWTLVTNGFASTPRIWTAVYNNGRFFIGGEYLFMLSTDDGLSWQTPNNIGLDSTNYFSIYTLAVNGSRIYAGESYRTSLLKSINGGNNWEHLSLSSLPEASNVYSITSYNSNDKEWWIISDAGIFYTDDTQEGWLEKSAGMNIGIGNSLAVFQNILFVGTPSGVQSLSGSWGLDNGFTDTKWHNTTGFFQYQNKFYAYGDYIMGLGDILRRPMYIYDVTVLDSIYATNGNAIYRANNSTNWMSVTPGYTFENITITRLFHKGNTLMAAGADYSYGMLYLLTRRNGRFMPTDSIELCYGMNTIAYKDTITFITPMYNGMLRSTTNQTGWKPVSGISEFADVSSLYCDGSRLYAWISDISLPDDGLYYSNDLGESWHYWGEGLPTTYSITVHNGYVYAATYAGVFKRPLSQLGISDQLKRSRILFGISPNPASEYITVSFNLDTQESARWRIVSSDGRTVSSSRESRLYSGSTDERINIRHLPNGKYFFVLETGDRSESASFIILR